VVSEVNLAFFICTTNDGKAMLICWHVGNRQAGARRNEGEDKGKGEEERKRTIGKGSVDVSSVDRIKRYSPIVLPQLAMN